MPPPLCCWFFAASGCFSTADSVDNRRNGSERHHVSLVGLSPRKGSAAALGVLVENPTLRNGFLLGLAIWSFCRLYYFAFYVIEKYIDPSFRFAGLFSVVRYFLQRRFAIDRT